MKKKNVRYIFLSTILFLLAPNVFNSETQPVPSDVQKKVDQPQHLLSDADDSTAISDAIVAKKIDVQTLLIEPKASELKLSATMPLTGSMSLVGDDYAKGINLVFDKLNRSGGLNKKYLIKYL